MWLNIPCTESSCGNQTDFKNDVKYAFRLRSQVLGSGQSTTHNNRSFILSSARTTFLSYSLAHPTSWQTSLFGCLSGSATTPELIIFLHKPASLAPHLNEQYDHSASLTLISLKPDFQPINREDLNWLPAYIPPFSLLHFHLLNHMISGKLTPQL